MYAMTYKYNSGNFSIHNAKCPQAKNGKETYLMVERFDDIEKAKNFADMDESERTGKEVKAKIKICNCAK